MRGNIANIEIYPNIYGVWFLRTQGLRCYLEPTQVMRAHSAYSLFLHYRSVAPSEEAKRPEPLQDVAWRASMARAECYAARSHGGDITRNAYLCVAEIS